MLNALAVCSRLGLIDDPCAWVPARSLIAWQLKAAGQA